MNKIQTNSSLWWKCKWFIVNWQFRFARIGCWITGHEWHELNSRPDKMYDAICAKCAKFRVRK